MAFPPMHPLQEAFFQALLNWDSATMAARLIEIVELVGELKCSPTAKRRLTWDCREFLECIESAINISSFNAIPQTPFQLNFSSGIKFPKGRNQLGKKVRSGFYLTLADKASYGVIPARWQQLGFIREEIEIDRELVKSPYPFFGEPGFSDKEARKHNIHKPGKIALLAEQTYAYACSLEQAERNQWLKRYRDGECSLVWRELQKLGTEIRDPEVLPLAIAVVRETMRRCRENVEAIVTALGKIDYPFKDVKQAFQPPGKNVLKQIATLEKKVGPLPLSFCAWYELVGSVNFIADYDSEWSSESADALYMESGSRVLKYDEECWLEAQYVVELSPDPLHKADYSGGPAYHIKLPNAAFDAPLEYVSYRTTLVDYLRRVFQRGGFAGQLDSQLRKRLNQQLGKLTEI